MATETEMTPRVNAGKLGTFTGQRVSFVGKVKEQNQGVIIMSSPESTPVTIQSSNAASFQVGGIYEVIGSVNPDCSIVEEQHIEYSDKFDLALYNNFLKLAHGDYAKFFYGK